MLPRASRSVLDNYLSRMWQVTPVGLQPPSLFPAEPSTYRTNANIGIAQGRGGFQATDSNGAAAARLNPPHPILEVNLENLDRHFRFAPRNRNA